MTTFAIYETSTGTLVSVGSVVANPLPANLSALELTNTQAVGLRSGLFRWDPPTRSLIAVPPDVRPANEVTLRDKAAAAMAGNDTAIAQAATARTNVTTNVLNAATGNVAAAGTQLDVLANVINGMIDQQVRTMNQLTAIEKLLLGGDHLLDTAGT